MFVINKIQASKSEGVVFPFVPQKGVFFDFWSIFIGAEGVPIYPLLLLLERIPIEKVVVVLVVADVVAAGLISFPLSVVQLKHDPNS